MDLNNYKKDIYSQNGEDGILEELFRRLKIEKGYFVDVGAWNGVYLSNTYNLLLKGWRGLDIEGNKNHFKGLIDTANKHPDLEILYRRVKPDEIDLLLSLFTVPTNFDLLNIDIDSYDYWIWNSMERYSPKVVVIESNGMDGDYIQPPVENYKGVMGTSIDPLIDLGRVKGYHYLGQSGNLFFVKDNYVKDL